ncbi:MAG: VWA domain-containing protein [Burkholderiaceae bacterium]|nr:VWA domain-containing protein [Burkholderiaceae bacterium]
MEEWVGEAWHRFITRRTARDFPEQAVTLSEIQKTIGVVFRGLGGDPGISLQTAVVRRHHARRRFMERIAGTRQHCDLCGLNDQHFRLPERIAIFDSRSLNRDLYIWLAALGAQASLLEHQDWIVRNQQASCRVLNAYPGLRPLYARLRDAVIATRIAPESMPADEAAQEYAVRQALADPGSVAALPALRSIRSKPPQPVPMWLYAIDDRARAGRRSRHQSAQAGQSKTVKGGRKATQQTDSPERQHGLLMIFRAESLLSWAEMVRVNRSVDDTPDDDAARAAEGMESLDITQDDDRLASRIRADLDVPQSQEETSVEAAGLPLPEWDYRSRTLRADYCWLQHVPIQDAAPIKLPQHLRPHARRIRAQLASLAPIRRWTRAQPDGSEPDLDAWIHAEADRCAGMMRDGGLYLAHRQQERDLACLVLADLSLSTDASVSDHAKVIDVIRDSLMIFAEGLKETGDRFAMYGFSSLRRAQVHFHELKSFARPFDDAARGRVQAIRPGDYTRLGAAVRYSTRLLAREPNRQKVLLILSDGKPHDLDLYEGRYGIEDTRQSILEARRQGIKPFCVTIDHEGADYLPHLFGTQGFALLSKPEHLTTRLAALYGQLTRD